MSVVRVAMLSLVLLAADAQAIRVPEVIQCLAAGDHARALALLKEIAALKGNHAEAKALVRMIRDAKVKKTDEVIQASFLALQGIGSRKVTRELLALLKHSKLKKKTVVRIGVCQALGGSADPSGAKTLIERMQRDRDDHVIAAAAKAAGSFRHARESIRKDLFRVILDIYEATWNLKNALNPDLASRKRRAEEKWEIIQSPMEKSLQLLSNVTQDDPPSWRRWWNKKKRKTWDDLDN